MMKMNTKKRAAAFVLSSILTILTGAVSWAAVKPEEYEEEAWEALLDNTIEYHEIYDLIQFFNPNMQIANASFEDGLSDIIESRDGLNDNIKDILDLASELAREGEKDQAESYRTQVKQLQNMRNSLSKSINSANSASKKIKISQAQDTLTAATQTLMNAYAQTCAQKDMVDKSLELLNKMIEATKTQEALGLATSTDLLQAEAKLAAAKTSSLKLSSNLVSMQASLAMITGLQYGSDVQIGAIPQVTLEDFSSINLEEDKQVAINNNYTYRQEHMQSVSSHSTEAKLNRERTRNEEEYTIAMNLESKYNALNQSRMLQESKMTTYEKAVLAKNGADSKYQLGMMSKLEYLQAEMEFMQAKGEKEAADMAYYQSLENYRWTLKGLD